MQALARRLETAPLAPWPDRPVPVALVITELDVGGAEKALVALATGLNPTLWAPRVIGLGPEGPLAAPLREAGIPVQCLAVSASRPIQAVRRLAQALRDSERPALVQSSLFHANVASRLAGRWAGQPWVVGGLRVAERQKRWHLLFDRLTVALGTGAVCVSEGVRRFSRDIGGLPDSRLTVIPNAVDVAAIEQAERVSRDSLGIPDGAFLALFVGRLTEQKGLPILLEAAARVIALRSDWYLAIAGDGPERSWLREQVSRNPYLTKRTQILGKRPDVPGLLKTADLLVLPSLWEGMPNVVLEAMAARRAVVATAVEGSEDIILPGETGWLVPPGDPDSLSDALMEASADRARLDRFGAAAHARAHTLHTPAEMVLAYERLWAGVLGLRHPAEGS